MKLKRLWINGFKNLNNFELNFSDKNGITVLIGNNGSGKSNAIEAISAIFTALTKMNTPQRKPIFEYKIEYELEENEFYHLSLTKTDNGEMIYSFHKNSVYIPVGTFKTNFEQHLPSTIIAIYSGEEQRLWEKYYIYAYKDFINKIKGEFQGLPSPKLFYINRFHWNISLLSLLYSEFDNNIKFCKKLLKINDLNNIKININFNMKNITNFQDNSIVSFIKYLNPNNDKNISITIADLKSYEFISSEKELFIKLMASVMNKESKYKLIEDITIYYTDELTSDLLSEGEKKQILIRTVLEVLADDKSLVLMDEPDANIHVSNKKQINTMLDEYINRNTILTTHSPTLTHQFDDKHIVMLNNGKVENKSKQEVFSHITDGIWNYQEQSIFLSSTKEIILLVEGKHDKIHIEEAFKRLHNDYDELDFDIFDMHGEANIKHMILGLANNGMDFNNKKIIAIFDNDKAGQDSFKNSFKKIENKVYKQLTDSNGEPSNIFFGFMLPKTDGFSNNFTIENMYSGKKYKDAFYNALAQRTDNNFFNDFVDEVSKQIKEDTKNILANNCKNFEDNDFEHFKKLFDLILEIKRQDNGNT